MSYKTHVKNIKMAVIAVLNGRKIGIVLDRLI